MIEVKLSHWLQDYYPDQSRPSKNTVYAWLKCGQLSGVRRGSSWFIRVKSIQDLTPVELDDSKPFDYVTKAKRVTNPLVKKVLGL